MNPEELTETAEAEEITTAPEQEPEQSELETLEEEAEVTAADETSVEEIVTQITSSIVSGSEGSESETTTTIDVDTALLYEINTNLTANNGILLAFGIVAFLIIIYKILRFVI